MLPSLGKKISKKFRFRVKKAVGNPTRKTRWSITYVVFVFPDRVHGGVHAVHQHRRPLRRRHELQGRAAVGVRHPRPGRISGVNIVKPFSSSLYNKDVLT